MLVRPADDGHLAAVAALNEVVQQIHHEARPDWFGSPNADEIAAWLRSALPQDETFVFVAEDEGEVVGYARGWFLTRFDVDDVYVGEVGPTAWVMAKNLHTYEASQFIEGQRHVVYADVRGDGAHTSAGGPTAAGGYPASLASATARGLVVGANTGPVGGVFRGLGERELRLTEGRGVMPTVVGGSRSHCPWRSPVLAPD